MPAPLKDERRPSVLDRLAERRPGDGREARASSWDETCEGLNCLRRDLTVLLNTRRAHTPFDFEGYQQAAASIVTFGIPDFTGANLENRIEQERLRLSIERAIRQFEPRLTRVSVALDDVETLKPVVVFTISASVDMDETAEDVFLSAILHRDSRRIAIHGASR